MNNAIIISVTEGVIIMLMTISLFITKVEYAGKDGIYAKGADR